MSDRLQRRSLLALLASLPAIVVGLLVNRRVAPEPTAATAQDPECSLPCKLRHVEQVNRTLDLQELSRTLDLQEQFLHRQAERDALLSGLV